MRKRLGLGITFVVMAATALACSKDNTVDASQNNVECGDNTLDCVPCVAGEYRCDGATLKVCQDDGQGFDAVSMCVSEALCTKGLPQKVCAAPVCNPADTNCDGPTMAVCSTGRDAIEVTTCASADACIAGLKNGKCAGGQCATAADCGGQDTECRKVTCKTGTCGFEDIPNGTPVQAQTVGDCKQAVCDGTGATKTVALVSDVPDDGEECTAESCDGSSPQTTFEPEGTGCSGGGVCNGAGHCKGCLAGATRCLKNALQTCDADGEWSTEKECVDQSCVNGACVGICAPGSKKCEGQIPQTCNSSGTWVGSTECSGSACVEGACVGNCVPGSSKCEGQLLQTCEASGSWSPGVSCGFEQLCTSGNCTCGNGRFIIVEQGLDNCGTSASWGLVLDTSTGLTWFRKSENVVWTPGQAQSFCMGKGMRLPTKDEALGIAGVDSCAFPCWWEGWTTTPTGAGKYWYVRSDGSAFSDRTTGLAMCVK